MIPANVVPQLNNADILVPSNGESLGSRKVLLEGQKNEFMIKLDQAVQGDSSLPSGQSQDELQALKSALDRIDEDSSKEASQSLIQPPVVPNPALNQNLSIPQQSEANESKLNQDKKTIQSDYGNSRMQGPDLQAGVGNREGEHALASNQQVIPLQDFQTSLLGANPIESELKALESGDVDLTSEIQEGGGISAEKLLPDSSAKIEHLKTTMQSEVKGVQLEKAPSLPSRVSTEDFLNLRELRKGKSARDAASTGVAAGMEQLQKGPLHLGPVIDAPVTHGTAGKTVLSHDAIHQISHQVNLLGKARQDGEIKIRLKPDHLGELVMNVKSRGNEVSIQIKTHDLEAKKIIEESIGRLKESLSVQNLSLSKMDVVTQPSGMQSADQFMQMDFNQGQNQFGRGDSQSWNDSGRGTRQEFLYDEVPVSATLKSMSAARAGRTSGAGNLDLIA
jgi:flagellar hook-length control protein FliK